MPEEPQQEGGGQGARCWPQWTTSGHSRSPASEAPPWLITRFTCRAFTSPTQATAHKEARGSPRSTVHGMLPRPPPPPRAEFPKGRKACSLPKVSVYLPSHIPAGLHLPRVGLLFLSPTKVAGTTSIPGRFCIMGWGIPGLEISPSEKRLWEVELALGTPAPENP